MARKTNQRTRTPKHIGDAELRALVAASRTPSVEHRRHLASCHSCDSLLDFLRDAKHFHHENACPDAEQLTRFVDSSVGGDAAARKAVDLHLSLCLDCALEVEGLIRVAALGVAPPVATSGAKRRPPKPSLTERLCALVVPEMPLAVAVSTRGLARSSTSNEHAAGMAAYRARRFTDARRLLRAARRAGDDSPGLSFYLGVLHFGRRQSDDAVRELERAAHSRPRLGMYRWYLAQALLLAGEGSRALAELKRTAKLHGAYAERAEALAAKVERAINSE